MCTPIKSTCPSNTIPAFIVNKRTIPWPFGSTEEDDIYINDRLMLCIRNTESDNSTILEHEICHIHPSCDLCPVADGEVQLLQRTEVAARITGEVIN